MIKKKSFLKKYATLSKSVAEIEMLTGSDIRARSYAIQSIIVNTEQ